MRPCLLRPPPSERPARVEGFHISSQPPHIPTNAPPCHPLAGLLGSGPRPFALAAAGEDPGDFSPRKRLRTAPVASPGSAGSGEGRGGGGGGGGGIFRVESDLSDLARSPLLGEYRGIMNLCRWAPCSASFFPTISSLSACFGIPDPALNSLYRSACCGRACAATAPYLQPQHACQCMAASHMYFRPQVPGAPPVY